MNKTLTILLASAAITAAIGIPAWSATQSPATDVLQPLATQADASNSAPIRLAEDSDHEDGASASGNRSYGEHEDEDEDECEDDDGACGPASPAPAAAGTVAPPSNGLFSNGAAPKVQVK